MYLETRLEAARHCILVIIGADPSGQKELVGFWDGYRESAQSRKKLLLDLKSRGLEHGPALAIGNGALGLWKALGQVDGQTRWQRCWVHKTANVLDKLPKDLQLQAKQRLQAIWMAPDRQRAEMAFDLFIATYEGKYPQAAECRVQDHEVLLAFYNFPADIPHPSLRFASFLYSLEVVYYLLTIRGDCYARPSPVPSSSLGSPRPCRRHVRRTGPFGDGLDHATRQNPEMRDLIVGAAVKAMVFNGLGLPCS